MIIIASKCFNNLNMVHLLILLSFSIISSYKFVFIDLICYLFDWIDVGKLDNSEKYLLVDYLAPIFSFYYFLEVEIPPLSMSDLVSWNHLLK